MMTDADFIREVQSCERTLYRVSRTILSSDADCCDAVQEALTRAWKHRNDVNPSFFKTWLVRILINECYRIYRQKQFAPSNDFTFKENLSDEADYSELYHAMMQLDDKYRIPVELYYIEGYKIHEITDILNRSEGTIKSQLARGRQQLRKYLESEAAQ